METLVLGGTRFMGKHLVRALLDDGHSVSIATRGRTPDGFGGAVQRLTVERTDPESLRAALAGRRFDVVFDSLAYSSNDVFALLEAVDCKRYVQISSASVYENLGMDTREDAFAAERKPLVRCGRADFGYDEVKRQAECAIVHGFPALSSVRVRFPYVVGTDDYTERLYFYVRHAVQQKPMHVDTPDAKIAFVRSDEAGRFLAFLGESGFAGAVNGASAGTITVREITAYVREKTGIAPDFSEDGDDAPYNGESDYSLHTALASSLGFAFTPLENWIYPLLDAYIERAKAEKSGRN